MDLMSRHHFLPWVAVAVFSCALVGCGESGDGDKKTTDNTDTGTNQLGEGEGEGEECWLDPLTNLCWQDPPSDSPMNWYRASGTYDADLNPGTENYCGALDHGGRSDWRLPNIDELISLIRGCQDGTATSDMSKSLCEMTPTGCAATDTCGDLTTCSDCLNGSGPASGCYWDPALGETCDWYWSSSSDALYLSFAWGVGFNPGYVFCDGKSWNYRVRCVRSGP
jgi:hypothetical protein